MSTDSHDFLDAWSSSRPSPHLTRRHTGRSSPQLSSPTESGISELPDKEDHDKAVRPSKTTWSNSFRNLASTAKLNARGTLSLLTSMKNSPSSRPDRPSFTSYKLPFMGNETKESNPGHSSLSEKTSPVEKGNHSREARLSWTSLDFKFGSLFSQSYKAVASSEPELSSASSSSSLSSISSPDDMDVNSLTIKEQRHSIDSEHNEPALSDEHAGYPENRTGDTATSRSEANPWSIRQISYNLVSNNQYESLAQLENDDSTEDMNGQRLSSYYDDNDDDDHWDSK